MWRRRSPRALWSRPLRNLGKRPVGDRAHESFLAERQTYVKQVLGGEPTLEALSELLKGENQVRLAWFQEVSAD